MTTFERAVELVNSLQPGEEREYNGDQAFTKKLYELKKMGIDLHTRKWNGARIVSKPHDPESITIANIAAKSLAEGLITEAEFILLTPNTANK